MPELHRSVLDLSIVSAGATSGDALAATTELARRAEALGYDRFWVAEHHNMPTVASTSPAVLMAHLAASTSRIKVGSGGVMLPNHAPLVVAEQFAMLEALHPGRVDLGIGRAPGTDPATAAALRRSSDALGADDFPRDLLDLMGMLGDERVQEGSWSRLRATPAATSSPQIVLLGSSGYSAQLAGQLGLAFGFAHHFDTPGVMEAVALYRESFRPSPELDEPYTIVTAGVLAADDAEQAEHLAGPSRLAVLNIRTGRRMAMVSPDEAAVHADIATARAMPSNRIVGDAGHVAAALQELAERTGAVELMVSTMTYGLPERIRTLELVAEHWPVAVA
ncbi:MAG: LLM class flavin-dependent oxidoreductase [Ilumatobacteraceae bacterium]